MCTFFLSYKNKLFTLFHYILVKPEPVTVQRLEAPSQTELVLTLRQHPLSSIGIPVMYIVTITALVEYEGFPGNLSKVSM